MNINYIFLRSNILQEINNFKEVFTKSESLWKVEYQKFNKEINIESTNLDEYEVALLRENNGVRLHELNKILPNLQRQANLVLLHSYIEKNLVTICNVFHNTSLEQIEKLNKGQSKILESVESYLAKHTKSEFPKNNTFWREIKTIRMVRNRIVHYGALVEENNRKCNKYIHGCKYLETRNALEECDDFSGHKYLAISIRNGFLNHYLEIFELFVEDVFELFQGKRANSLPIKIKKSI